MNDCKMRIFVCSVVSMVFATMGHAESSSQLATIAFGSCTKESTNPQPLWEKILSVEPDLWIWSGDTIYGDTRDMDWMRAKFDLQKHQPDYKVFRTTVPVIGTWDDHDFGENNAGRDYPKRAETQQLFLDFVDEPAYSPRREREGVYTSYTYGPEGRRAKVILLDGRYHRDKPREDGAGDILGGEQWAWLEGELEESDAQVHLIVSGIQILPMEHNNERWHDFPAARERLFQLIAETRAPGVILVSGDRHMAEISRVPAQETPIDYALHEVTSSGMTHSWDSHTYTVYMLKNYGVLDEPNRYRVGGLNYRLKNFGTILIDWDAEPVELSLQVRNEEANVIRERIVTLDQLQPARGTKAE